MLLLVSLASLAGAPDSGLFHQAQDLLSCGLLNHRGRGRWQGAGGAGTSAVSDFVRFIGSAAAGRGCHGCLCDKGQKYGPCHSLLPIFLWLWSHGGWEALAVCTSSSPAPGFSGLWAQLLWLVSGDCRRHLHCVSGSPSSVCSRPPIFRCTDNVECPSTLVR